MDGQNLRNTFQYNAGKSTVNYSVQALQYLPQECIELFELPNSNFLLQSTCGP